MIEVSQQVLHDLLTKTSRIMECISFLIGYGIARIKSLGGIFAQLVNSLLEGFRFGDGEYLAAISAI